MMRSTPLTASSMPATTLRKAPHLCGSRNSDAASQTPAIRRRRNPTSARRAPACCVIPRTRLTHEFSHGDLWQCSGVSSEAHIGTAIRLLLIQTIGGLAVGGVITGVLIATTRLGLSGALFVAAIVVAVAGIAWSLGGPKRGLPATLGIARLDDPVSISQRPVGTSQADAVLVISSVLVGLLLAAAAVIAAR